MAKQKITEELPETESLTEELPEDVSMSEELPETPSTVKVLYDPDHDYPGILNGVQVQPGEIHEVPYGVYLTVEDNKAYKVVE